MLLRSIVSCISKLVCEEFSKGRGGTGDSSRGAHWRLYSWMRLMWMSYREPTGMSTPVHSFTLPANRSLLWYLMALHLARKSASSARGFSPCRPPPPPSPPSPPPAPTSPQRASGLGSACLRGQGTRRGLAPRRAAWVAASRRQSGPQISGAHQRLWIPGASHCWVRPTIL